jgi:DNA helicase-2/ATP-dependent DNA helicase PcrA
MAAFRNMMDGLHEAVETKPLNEALAFIEERTGYRRMLEQENTPESQAKIENLNELMNAAAEAVERGETIRDFLDHAALVAQSDAIDEASQITLMTIHNAKGLEFPVVFLAGMEDGLFPHSRTLLSEAAMEEERRLCYVGMTRSEKRLVLSWARYRRRFGGGEQERTLPSRFLKEVPSNLVIKLGVDEDDDVPQVDLTAERWQVREQSRKNLYTGKTYNSVENVAQFFKERGVNVPMRGPSPPPAAPANRFPFNRPAPVVSTPVRSTPPPATPAQSAPRAPIQSALFGDAPAAPPRQMIPPVQSRAPLPKAPPFPPKVPPAPKQAARTGTVVEHPKYGKGTVVRREGDGDDAKVVVIFQRHGMKKLVEKYAGLTRA